MVDARACASGPWSPARALGGMPRTLCSDLVYYREPVSLAVCVMCVCEFDAGLARVRCLCVVQHGLVMSCPLFSEFVVFGGLEFERPDRVRDVSRAAIAPK